ncbi:MAG: hypothetical protein LV481_04315 [Methylacidiphilales bacterium]|nr:hypothetical protein [Candidatus Methylacidiphilales bacterium]
MLRHNRSKLFALAVLFSALLSGGATQAFAYNGYNEGRNGYWDNNHNYHQYGYYHHHRGYWNQNNGVRLWINVG